MFSPIAFSIGFFSVTWYALCYLVGAFVVVTTLFFSRRRRTLFPRADDFWSLITLVLWGIIIGARLGYIIFYGDLGLSLREPWRSISPYDFETRLWTGIRGLSFYGGVVGGALGLLFFTAKKQRRFFGVADWVVAVVPLAFLFGRLGNFLNHELLGRPSTAPWAMRFTPDGTLRHPSQLYEALGEGLALYVLLFFLSRRDRFPGFLVSVFLIAYGGMRFTLEFFREPDDGAKSLFWGVLTGNQLAALVFLVIGLWLYQSLRRAWYNTRTKAQA